VRKQGFYEKKADGCLRDSGHWIAVNDGRLKGVYIMKIETYKKGFSGVRSYIKSGGRYIQLQYSLISGKTAKKFEM
jgi:hypothetical protein